VLQVRPQPAIHPRLLQLELWQSNLLLAPACTVLLLPGSMAGVAAELQALYTHEQSQAGRGKLGLGGLNTEGFIGDFRLWCQAVHSMGRDGGSRGGGSGRSAAAAGCSDADDGAREQGEWYTMPVFT